MLDLEPTERELNALSILSCMNAGKEQPWSPMLAQVYLLILREIGEELGQNACLYAIRHETWRPAPAKLREIAGELASPLPPEPDVYAEIVDKARQIGLYGQPHPDRPGLTLTGSPPMSHPLVARVVAYLGGWAAICDGSANLHEGLRKQVHSAYATARDVWLQAVCRELAKPADERDRVYFPGAAYTSYRAEMLTPGVESVPRRLPPAPVPPRREEIVDERARAAFRQLRDQLRTLPEETTPLRRESLTKAEREAHLAELQARQARLDAERRETAMASVPVSEGV